LNDLRKASLHIELLFSSAEPSLAAFALSDLDSTSQEVALDLSSLRNDNNFNGKHLSLCEQQDDHVDHESCHKMSHHLPRNPTFQKNIKFII